MKKSQLRNSIVRRDISNFAEGMYVSTRLKVRNDVIE